MIKEIGALLAQSQESWFYQSFLGIWVFFGSFFMFFKLLSIRITSHQNLCCVSKSMMKHQPKSDKKLDLP